MPNSIFYNSESEDSKCSTTLSLSLKKHHLLFNKPQHRPISDAGSESETTDNDASVHKIKTLEG